MRRAEFVAQQRGHGVGVRVDETGEDVQAGGVDHPVGGCVV